MNKSTNDNDEQEAQLLLG